MSVLNGREQFEAYYKKEGGCLLATVKENHWRTWLAAQVALLEAQWDSRGKIHVVDEEKAE